MQGLKPARILLSRLQQWAAPRTARWGTFKFLSAEREGWRLASWHRMVRSCRFPQLAGEAFCLSSRTALLRGLGEGAHPNSSCRTSGQARSSWSSLCLKRPSRETPGRVTRERNTPSAPLWAGRFPGVLSSDTAGELLETSLRATCSGGSESPCLVWGPRPEVLGPSTAGEMEGPPSCGQQPIPRDH